MVSVLTFRPVSVQPWTISPLVSVAWLPSCEVVVWLSAVAMGALNAANAPAAAMAAEANPRCDGRELHRVPLLKSWATPPRGAALCAKLAGT